MRVPMLLLLLAWSGLACRPTPASTATPGPAPDPAPATDANIPTGRLDDRALPLRYRLRFTLDEHRPQFAAVAQIDLRLTRPTRTLFLHARGLTVTAAHLRLADGTSHVVTPDLPGDDLLRLQAPVTLPVGDATLTLTYDGTWGQEVGLVRSRDRRRPVLFATDFQPHDARAAFPCFDDPRFRTPFELTVIAPTALTTVSNTPLVRATIDGSWTTHVFAPTPPITTYMVALASGAYEVTEATTGTRPIRVFYPTGTGAQFAYLAESAATTYAWMRAYLDADTPFPKIDLWILPSLQGETGGMENPGLITLQPGLVRARPADDDQARLGPYVVAHELAHMWFGNSVTPAWWDDAWLSEGFATFFSDLAMSALHADWSFAEEGLGYFPLHGRSDEALVREISGAADDASEAKSMFVHHTYAGGAAVLATWRSVLGDDGLREVLRKWVARHQLASVTSRDFADTLAAAPGLDPAQARAAFDHQLHRTKPPQAKLSVACGAVGSVLRVQVDRGLSGVTPPTPVCVRELPSGTPTCWMVETVSAFPRASCPQAVWPDDRGRGGLRWQLEAGELSRAVHTGALTVDDLEAAWVLRGEHRGAAVNDAAADAADTLDLALARLVLRLRDGREISNRGRAALRLIEPLPRPAQAIALKRFDRLAQHAGVNLMTALAKPDQGVRDLTVALAELGDATARAVIRTALPATAKPSEIALHRAITLDVDQRARNSLWRSPPSDADLPVVAQLAEAPPGAWLARLTQPQVAAYTQALAQSPSRWDELPALFEQHPNAVPVPDLLAIVELTCRPLGPLAMARLPAEAAAKLTRTLTTCTALHGARAQMIDRWGLAPPPR